MNRRELGWPLAMVLGGWAGVAFQALAQTVSRMPRIGVLRCAGVRRATTRGSA